MKGSTHPNGDKIAKILATVGLCSRREAERWIAEGRVQYQGEVLTDCAVRIKDLAHLRVDGMPLPQKSPVRLWIYYKPKGVITSHKDPQGRPTLFDQLKDLGAHVVSVGRLDFNSEGLILITNRGALARMLELPSTGVYRTYRVRVYGPLSQDALTQIRAGLVIDTVAYQGATIVVERQDKTYQWLNMTLKEGKNREIRRIIEHFGGQVTRLIRTHYGPFGLGDLAPGACVEVDHTMVKHLLKELEMDNECV